MLNLTLLSFTIASSFQKSPFLHIPSTLTQNINIYKNINAQRLFSSFLITQSFNSFSVIEGSIFNRFITSLPILCFKSKEAKLQISNQAFYGDTIPGRNNKFYRTNYTEIINCKFMSITDNNNDQPFIDGGLCIFSTQSAKIDSCYFFAILSRRSGSAILFGEDENIQSMVTNCMFKSITQTPSYSDIMHLTGGAVSYGNVKIKEDVLDFNSIYLSLTNNCCFDKVRLIGGIYPAMQIGIVTYISTNIKSTNLNFTDNEMQGYFPQYGVFSICVLGNFYDSFTFINIFDCKYNYFGCFSLILILIEEHEFSLSFTNLINNSQIEDKSNAQFTIIETISDVVFLKFTNIQCNNKNPFFDIFYELPDYKRPVDITVSNSLFGCSFQTFILDKDHILMNPSSENNIFDCYDFDVDITNNIISIFGYVQTSQFSASNEFTNSYATNSTLYFFDLDVAVPYYMVAIAFVLVGISLIVFFMSLFYHGKNKFDIDQFEQLDFDNEMEDNSINEFDEENKNNNTEKSIEMTINTEKKSDFSESMKEKSFSFETDTNKLNDNNEK